ncbi:MAG: DUF222 domain-containing protein [Kofleriaceae bacterium]
MVQRHGKEANPDDDKDRRHVARSDTSDGMVRIAAVLHPEEAAMVWAALERILKEGHRGASSDHAGAAVPAGIAGEQRSGEDHHDDSDDDLAGRDVRISERHVPAGISGHAFAHPPARRHDATVKEQRFNRADALVEMAQEILRGTRPARAPTELVVTIFAERLRARPVLESYTSAQPAEVDDLSDVGCCADGTAVSVDVVRRLACDAGIVAMVEGLDGSPMTLGRKTRSIPGSMKRALLQRDRGCRFPGCTNRLFVEGHHVKHWADGGETKLTNIVLICSHHHRFVHEYGYRVELLDSEVTFVDPRGRVVDPAPGPARSEGRGWETIRRQNAHLDIDERTIACEWDGQRLNLIGCIDELVRADDRADTDGSDDD